MKYSRVGEKLRSKIKHWREMGNPNVVHYEYFLDAESAAWKNKKSDAIKNYKAAISHAARTGFVQDAAFACERLSEFHLTVTGEEEEAAYQMNQSLKYWRGWGAMAKVEALENKWRARAKAVSRIKKNGHPSQLPMIA